MRSSPYCSSGIGRPCMATLVVLLAAVVSACGTPTASPAAPATVTETATVTVTASATPTALASIDHSSDSASADASRSDSTVVVPDGVGVDYQTAQDRWRGAGLVVMPANDATGANRIPIIDRNWVVLAQDPKPGTKVEVGAEITATVKKYTDS